MSITRNRQQTLLSVQKNRIYQNGSKQAFLQQVTVVATHLIQCLVDVPRPEVVLGVLLPNPRFELLYRQASLPFKYTYAKTCLHNREESRRGTAAALRNAPKLRHERAVADVCVCVCGF